MVKVVDVQKEHFINSNSRKKGRGGSDQCRGFRLGQLALKLPEQLLYLCLIVSPYFLSRDDANPNNIKLLRPNVINESLKCRNIIEFKMSRKFVNIITSHKVRIML